LKLRDCDDADTGREVKGYAAGKGRYSHHSEISMYVTSTLVGLAMMGGNRSLRVLDADKVEVSAGISSSFSELLLKLDAGGYQIWCELDRDEATVVGSRAIA
jgi:hypothetical protein